MSSLKKREYGPVDDEDEDDEYSEKDTERLRPKPEQYSLSKTVVWVEIANILILLLIYAVYLVATKKVSSEPDFPFTISRTFEVNKTDLRYVKSGPIADAYWRNLTFEANNGLITVPLSYANAHNLTPSRLPAAPAQTVFQVDVFHQIHCLERVRGFIVSAQFLFKLNPDRTEEHEFTKHILHCVDYLRQAVLCNADTTLVSTTTDLEFDKSPPRMCRDFDKVMHWVMNNRYDYDRWLNGIGV